MTGDPVAEILALYEGPGAARLYDESVTELAHALQCAEQAIAEGAGGVLVAAALLHDIGHLLAGGHAAAGGPVPATGVDDRHEATGAAFLRRTLGPSVSAPVALHVAAKRYLCATDAAYQGGLSAASIHSLAVQGGPLSPEGVAAFRRRAGWGDAVRLRVWDDQAKVVDAPTRSLRDHAVLLRSIVVGGAADAPP